MQSLDTASQQRDGTDTTFAGYSSLAGVYNNQAWLFDGTKGISFSQNITDANIDFGSVHLYPEYWNLSAAAGSAFIADHARIARAVGKPLVVGEFGASFDTATTYGAWL